MHNRFHASLNESPTAQGEHGFAARRVSPIRRETLNFEIVAEPDAQGDTVPGHKTID